ncbi:MAG: hypothetical protein ACYCPP_08200 [Nitrososphaerales archaeon]
MALPSYGCNYFNPEMRERKDMKDSMHNRLSKKYLIHVHLLFEALLAVVDEYCQRMSITMYLV